MLYRAGRGYCSVEIATVRGVAVILRIVARIAIGLGVALVLVGLLGFTLVSAIAFPIRAERV